MHAPDGFLNAGTAVATGAVSAGAVGASLRQMRTTLGDRQVPLAGLTAAFVFAAQMFNFPVAAGTTGHLLGGALAAILLGPAAGAVVVTVVVVVQALAFADGGLTALGYNVLNMAVVTAFGGYGMFVLLRRVLPANATGVVVATGLAAGLSVPLSAMAFAIEWLFGASAPVPFDTVFGAMVGVHLLIGVGEGVISAMAVGAVLAARPDLVYGARDLTRAQTADRPRIGMRGFVIGMGLVALVFAMVVSQFAAPDPDGLERVAQDQGFSDSAQDHALANTPFADYATEGLGNETVSLAVAGLAGVAITLIVGLGIVVAVRDRQRPGRPARDPGRDDQHPRTAGAG
jgi:cobalt/nickel transport system permease protein